MNIHFNSIRYTIILKGLMSLQDDLNRVESKEFIDSKLALDNCKHTINELMTMMKKFDTKNKVDMYNMTHIHYSTHKNTEGHNT